MICTALFFQQLNFIQQRNLGYKPEQVAVSYTHLPKMILADEPTGNLDSSNGEQVMNLLRELNNEGTTIVMVTHSPHDSGFAHRVINLFDGKVVTENFHV